jgi:hypothetical protein
MRRASPLALLILTLVNANTKFSQYLAIRLTLSDILTLSLSLSLSLSITRRHMLEPVRPESVLSDRALCLQCQKKRDLIQGQKRPHRDPQRQCYPTGLCAYRPSVTSLIVNKTSLSLSLTLSFTFCLSHPTHAHNHTSCGGRGKACVCVCVFVCVYT